MNDSSKFAAISPTSYADAGLGRSQFMDMGIREMWSTIPRIAGPAYTVSCPPGDNLMLHAAIYRAEPGSVIVVQAGDTDYAMSGGNVCATAQQRGIAGFVIDGVIRDVAEVREAEFAVFARGLSPVPGKKQALGTLNQPITCGGVQVNPGDMVVADEEGIAVHPPRGLAAHHVHGHQQFLDQLLSQRFHRPLDQGGQYGAGVVPVPSAVDGNEIGG